MTLDVEASIHRSTEFDWKHRHEAFVVCRQCGKGSILEIALKHTASSVANKFDGNGTVAKIESGALNRWFEVEGHVSLRDESGEVPPDHLPEDIAAVFTEGATCLSTQCWNAAGTMFRLCVDIATRALVPADERPGLSGKVERDLGLRVPWLLENGLLPAGLKELSTSIREDASDGAPVGSLKKEDAEDLLDFTRALLERLYTEPEKLRLATERREQRRLQE